MLTTTQFACSLPKAEADAKSAESGRVYTDTLVQHYRRYRKQGVWLSQKSGERLEGCTGEPTTLHAHSRDAAKPRFYKACKTAAACRELGLDIHYPHKRKRFRTTVWKHTGIRKRAGTLVLARARGLTPVEVPLPSHLSALPACSFLEARLVWDRAARHYTWHLVTEDGNVPSVAQGETVMAVDLGEIHPAAITDGKQTVIIACRAMRANQQYTAKRLSELRSKQSRKKKGSRRWKRLQRRKTRFLAKQRRRSRDLENNCCRAVGRFAQEREASLVVIGDVRDVADGKRLAAKSQQKISVWAHGRFRQYITGHRLKRSASMSG